MQKGLIIAIIVAGTVVVGGFALSKVFKGGGPGFDGGANPWIEVAVPTARELERDTGQELRELQTGDEFSGVAQVATDKGAFANIYLPDGSVIRLDGKTSFVLTEGSFDPKSGDTTVRIKLAEGRVWSKIFELATPESLWEVETSNTVATVRGSAFGIEYVRGTTRIIGSENEVVVRVIDPETREVIPDARVVIAADKFIEITDEDIERIKEDKTVLTMAVQNVRGEILEEVWVRRSKEADVEFNKRVDALRKEGLGREAIRQKMRAAAREILGEEREEKEIRVIREEEGLTSPEGERETRTQEELRAVIEAEVDSILKIEADLTPRIESSKAEKESAVKVEAFREEVNVVVPAVPKPEKLILEIKNNVVRIEEGVPVYFEAILAMDNGERKTVTDTTTWQVLGPIGTITSPGIFVPKLDISVAELGESFGTIVATWKDEQSGIILLGTSDILNVKAKIEAFIDERG